MHIIKSKVAHAVVRCVITFGAAVSVGCATSSKGREVLDHVVVGITDLDRGVNEIQSLTGIKPAYGGPHPELGTHNALLSLGEGEYLEVIAPQEGAQLAEQVKILPSLHELTPAAWAIRTLNMADTIELLQRAGYETTTPRAASRTKPDGSVLRWKLFYITSPQIPMVPFFIEWDADSDHPAIDSPTGCSLASIEVETPAQAQLELLLGIVNIKAQVSSSDAGAIALNLNCGERQVRIGR